MPPSKALRPADLARAAGLSTQAVRNYVDDGVLPDVPRAENGYRRFEERHRDALLLFRELGPGVGWAGAREIMWAIHRDDVRAALETLDIAHGDVQKDRTALREVEAALAAVDVEGQGTIPVPADGVLIGDLARLLQVRTSALRVWEAAGLLAPERDGDGWRRYRVADVRDAQVVVALRRGNYPLETIHDLLARLHEARSTAELAAAVRERRGELDERSLRLVAGGAALHRYLRDHPAGPRAGVT